MLRQHVANPALRRDVASHDSYVEKAKTEINKAYRGVKFLPKIVNRDVSALKFFHPATNMCLDVSLIVFTYFLFFLVNAYVG